MSAERQLFLFCGLLGLAGCNKHPASDPQAGAPASAQPPPAVALSSSALAAAIPSDPPPLPVGCFDSLSPGTSEAMLKQLGERCAPGMQPLWPSPRVLKLTAGTAGVATLRIEDPSRCLRAAAIGPPGAILSLQLLSPEGVLISSAALDARLGVLNPGGPICVDRAGDYQLAVELDSSGDVSLQGWLPSASRNTPPTPD